MAVTMTVQVGGEALSREGLGLRYPYKRIMVAMEATGDGTAGAVTGTHIFRDVSEPVSSDLVGFERISVFVSNTNPDLELNHIDFQYVRNAPTFASVQGFRMGFTFPNFSTGRVLRVDQVQPRVYIGRMSAVAANTLAVIARWDQNVDGAAYWTLLFYLVWDQEAIQQGGVLWPGQYER